MEGKKQGHTSLGNFLSLPFHFNKIKNTAYKKPCVSAQGFLFLIYLFFPQGRGGG